MHPTLRSCCWLLIFLASGLGARVGAAEYLPDRPTRYCNDYASLLKPETVHQLDQALEGAEYSSSNQVIVALYRSMRSNATMEDYCQRLAASWHVGQAGKANGVVLFYFKREQRFYIEVQPGLRSVLPDAEVSRIINERIIPWVKANDFDGAVVHGVAAILADTGDAYKGDLKHAYWLHPPFHSQLRFRDYLPIFFLFSVLFYVGSGIRSAVAGPARQAAITYGSSSVAGGSAGKPLAQSSRTASRRLVSKGKGSDKQPSEFWGNTLALLIVAGLVAIFIVAGKLFDAYLRLDRNPFLIVTFLGVCAIVFLPAWFAHSHWEIFRDENNRDKIPPPFWKISVSVAGILGVIVVGCALWSLLGLIGMILTGGVFAGLGCLLDLGGGSSSGGGGGIFGGGGGASSSW